MKLYHYRTVETALKEIIDGTFHYSDRSELNDPIEGYVQVYYQGDRPAWEGLFRNYICSLYQSLNNYLLIAKYKKIDKINVILLDIHCFDDVPFGKLLKDVADKFMENHYVEKVIEYLSQNNIKVFSKYLCYLLRLLHEIAFSICISSLKENKLVQEFQEKYCIPTEEIFPLDSVDKIEKNEREFILEYSEDYFEDMAEFQIIEKYLEEEYEPFMQAIKWLEVRSNFPLFYVNQMKEIIYPKGYVVCFSSDSTNSAMWGNYANNHEGVCLVYQTVTDGTKETLSVKSSISIGDEINFLFRKEEVKPVKYESSAIKRNVFESLGRLTYGQIMSWLISENGEKSKLIEKYSEKEWREKYWIDYEEKYCLKLPAWKHEKEYRLLLIEFLHEYSVDERMVEYDPKSLIGVIFGIKTTEFDKIRIIRAIKDTGRNLEKFKFYQAEYDEKNQCVKVRKKNYFF